MKHSWALWDVLYLFTYVIIMFDSCEFLSDRCLGKTGCLDGRWRVIERPRWETRDELIATFNRRYELDVSVKVSHSVSKINIDGSSLSIVEPELDRCLRLTLIDYRLASLSRCIYCATRRLCRCTHTRALAWEGDILGRRRWYVVLATFIFESDLQAPRVLLPQFCRHHSLFQFLYECGISWIIHRSERSIVLHLEAISPQNDLDVLCALGSRSLTCSWCSRATSGITASLINQLVEIVSLAFRIFDIVCHTSIVNKVKLVIVDKLKFLLTLQRTCYVH